MSPTTEQVLFVDDEPNVLDGIQRSLRNKVAIQTAVGGAEGLRLLQDAGPFAVVVSDMRMPGMDGAQFLAKVRQHSSDTVRMILSGQADLQSTIAAVNDGQIYRFLCKPVTHEKLFAAIEDGLQQHRLVVAEKVLLEQTLSGAVKMLIEILGMVSPAASSRAARLQRYVIELGTAMGLPSRWQWGLAAYVSQIGCVTLPKEILAKVDAARPLTSDEARLYDSHAKIAGKLLVSIPRLEEVAAIVPAQSGPLRFSELPSEIARWDVLSTGQLLLRTAYDFDQLISAGATREGAIEGLRASKLELPPAVLDALRSLKVAGKQFTIRELRVKDLHSGMVLDEDLVSLKGIRLVSAGHEVTPALIVKLTSIAEGVGVAEPFRTRVPG